MTAGRDVWPVCIVGAGPTGVAAANLLAQRGIECLVIERHADVYPLPRAVHFDDEVFRIFQTGLDEQVRAVSRPILGMQLLDGRHRVLTELRDPPEQAHGHPESNMFDQPDLERVLRAGLAGLPLVDFRGNVEVRPWSSTRTGAEPVRVTLRDLGPAPRPRCGPMPCSAATAHSGPRTAVGATMEDLGFASAGWSWMCAAPCRSTTRTASTRCATTPPRHLHAGAGPLPLGVHAGAGESRRRRNRRVLALTGPWLGAVDPTSSPMLRQAIYTFRALVADRWQRGRVFLLGDAAHQTPPFIGQGMCAGIRDAANLTWKLALVLAGRADDALLDTYQAERRPHVRRVIRWRSPSGG